MSLDQRADYRQVAVFNRLEEAEVARGMLEADGIPAALLDAQVAALGLGPAVGGVRLLVPAWDEGRALELLGQPAWTPGSGTPTPWGLTPVPGAPPLEPPPPRHPPGPAAFELAPALAAPGPLALRVAVLVALALAVAVAAALR